VTDSVAYRPAPHASPDGGTGLRTSVLIPVHNGSDSLPGILKALAPLPVDVWVSDDGSTDGTADVARAGGARAISFPVKSGKGAAMRRGIAAISKEEPAYDWVLFMDGDGQHLPGEVPAFLEEIGSAYDFLQGSRWRESERIPRARAWTNRIGSRVLAWFSGQHIPDTQCGFRAVRLSLLKRLRLESAGFEIETEILLKSLRAGARAGIIDITAVYGEQGSHFRPVHDTFRICMAGLRYAR